MASYRYDRHGRLVGYTKSRKDLEEDSEAGFAFLILAFAVVLLLPVLYPAFLWYRYLRTLEIHPLFASALTLAPTILATYLLYKFKLVRAIYFGLETVGLAVVVYQLTLTSLDLIWACFFCGCTLCAGATFTWWITTTETDEIW